MKYCIVILCLSMGILVHAQCGLDKSYTIVDLDNNKPDTTDIKILVTGAKFNDLSTPQQGVCGIKLKFRHPFMKELFVEIISPSGQKITLVGGDIVPTNTQLITWDVTFVPCGASAAPDFGFMAVWENNQAWQNLTTYKGQYYPHQGCLENFNKGSVDGVWTIRCIDFSDGGQGVLQDAKIIFCLDDGIACGQCKLNPGKITNGNINACSGSNSLIFDIIKSYPHGTYDTTVYVYTNAVFKKDTIIQYTNSADLTKYKPGIYTICGIQIAISQKPYLPRLGSIFTHTKLNKMFADSGVCGQISEDCMQITITSPPAAQLIKRSICKGDTVTINGKNYTQSGRYDIIIKQEPCDSLITLDLNIIDLQAIIIAEKDSISCANSVLPLNGGGSTMSDGLLQYHWFTNDGRIEGDISKQDIEVTSKGNYFLEVTLQSPEYTCKDTTSIQIKEDVTHPKIHFQGDTVLTCQQTSLDISAQISVPVKTVIWTSAEGNMFQQMDQNIIVVTPGKYYIEVVTTDGCISKDSIIVTEDKTLPQLKFEHNIINCKDTIITIMATPLESGDYTYFWSDVDLPFQNVQNPQVSRGGSYSVTITNVGNGCFSKDNVFILEDKIPPKINSIIVDTLNCKLTSVKPMLLSDTDIGTYQWTGNGLDSKDISPTIAKVGTYHVEITSSKNFCKQEAYFEVIGDFVAPIISISTDSITCIIDSVQLLTMSNVPLFNIKWTGSNFTKNGILSPYVHKEGIYTLEAEGKNGCKALANIQVINSKHRPEIVIKNDSIRCDADYVLLDINPDLPDRSYQWTGPGLLNNNIATPLVSLPGLYKVTVTNAITGCTYETDVMIMDARVFSKPVIHVSQLDCTHDSIQVTLSNRDVLSVEYFGNGFYSTKLSPYIKNPGKYYILLTNTHHCVTIDSFEVIRNVNLPEISVDYKPIQCGQDSVLIQGKSSVLNTTFVWSGPDGFKRSGQNIYSYKGGKYQVMGTAPNGCKMELDFEIGYDTIRPIFKILPADTLTCKKPDLTLQTDLDPSQGTIIWQPNGVVQDTLSVRSAGVYTAIVTGHNHCVSKDSIRVFENKHFPSFDVSASIINCRDLLSMIHVTPLTDYTDIFWDNAINPDVINDGKIQIRTSFPGIYHFTLVNAEGCKKSGEIEVKVDATPPIVKEIFTDTLNCKHPGIDIGVSVDGDVFQYLWNSETIFDSITTSGKLLVNVPGMYFLKITGSNYCVKNVVFDIIKDDDLPVYTLFGDTITCNKGKVAIGGNATNPDLSFVWTGPEGFVSTQKHPIVFTSGTYYVEVEGLNGCKVRDSIFVPEINTKPVISIASDTIFLPCDRREVQVTTTSSVTLNQYFWVFPNGSIVNNPTLTTNIPGKYRVQASDHYGCLSDFVYFDVVLDRTMPKVAIGLDTIRCNHTIATISANSSYPYIKYKWESPSGIIQEKDTIKTAESGQFLLITLNGSGCADTIPVFLPIDTLKPFIAVDLLGEIICQKANVTLDVSRSNQGKPFTAIWETNDGHIDRHIPPFAIHVDKAGHYKLLLTDAKNGCVNSDIIKVEELPSNFTVMDVSVTPPYCDQVVNGTIHIDSLNGTPPYKIEFNGLDVSGQRYFDGLRAGTYTLMVADANGCTQRQTVEIPHNGNLSLGLESEILIYFGDSVRIRPVIDGNVFGNHHLRWFVRDTMICDGCTELTVRPFVNTIYFIEHTIDGLCKQTISILIRVNRDLNTAVPNIFNPSSNNGNERFYIPQTRGIEKIKRLLIFDKWAENVYSIYDTEPGIKEIGWDGTFKGKACATGVYIIIADFILSNGAVWTYKGDVTLIR